MLLCPVLSWPQSAHRRTHLPSVFPYLSALDDPGFTSRSLIFTSHDVLYFHTLAHSFALPETLTPAVSSSSTLFAQNTRGGIPRKRDEADHAAPPTPPLVFHKNMILKDLPPRGPRRISFQRTYGITSACQTQAVVARRGSGQPRRSPFDVARLLARRGFMLCRG